MTDDERLIEWLTSEYSARDLAMRILKMASPIQRTALLEAEYAEWLRRYTREG